MAMPELSPSTSEKPESPSQEEAKENYLKYNLMKIMETLKEKKKKENLP